MIAITKSEKATALRSEDGRACPPPPMPTVEDDEPGMTGIIGGLVSLIASYYNPLLAYTIELALYTKRLEKRITELEKGKNEHVSN